MPDAPPDAASAAAVPPDALPSTPSQTWAAWRSDLAFWGLVGMMLAVLLAPHWLGAMPPLTDFGGHVQVAHGFARLGDDASGGAWPNVWAEIIERRDVWWLPNLLAVRIAGALHPMVDALTSLRLVSMLALVMTVIGHIKCLEVFGRSRWLVFLALPVLVMNGMVALGFINYYLGLACVPWAIYCARRITDGARLPWRYVALLGAVALFAFFAHGFASLVVMVVATVVLVVSLGHWRRIFAGLALLPAAALWLHWYVATRTGVEAKEARVELAQKLEAIGRESIDILPGTFEEHVLAVLALGVLFTFAAGILWGPPPVKGPDEGPRGWARVRAAAPWILFGALLMAYFALPTYMGDLVVSERLIPVFVAVLCLLPNARVDRWMTRVTLLVTGAATLVLGGVVARATAEFDRGELDPAMALISLVPKGVRAQCVDVQFARPVFHRRPLDHGCDGLIAVQRDAYAGGGFADTSHNAVAIREGRRERRLFDHRWNRANDLADIEWVLARGRHAAPTDEIAELVAWIDDRTTGERRWTLYRSILADLEPAPFEDVKGGPGGRPLTLDCPPGHALGAVTIVLTSDRKIIQGVGAECSKLVPPETLGGGAKLEGRRVRLPAPTVQGSSRRSLTCSGRRPIVGLAMRTGIYVDAAAVACAPQPGTALWAAPFGQRPYDLGTFRGGNGGRPNEVICPVDMIATGVRARAGGLVDALGIACRPLTEVLAAAAAPATHDAAPEAPAP